MSLRSTLTVYARPILALALVGGCLLTTPAQASGSKEKKASTEKAAPAATVSTAAPAAAAATAATVVLTGRIRNEEGQPLAGATVYLQGSDVVVSTDTEGKFVMEVPAAGKKTLRYGYGGYDDRDVVVGTSAPLTMSLHPSDETIKQRKDK